MEIIKFNLEISKKLYKGVIKIMEEYKSKNEIKKEISVEKLIAPGEKEKINLTTDQFEKIKSIVNEMGLQPFDSGIKDEDSTPQDWMDTIQYNLNHAKVEQLGLSDESVKFIKESGLFLG